MEIEYKLSGMPPCFYVKQLVEVLGIHEAIVRRIMNEKDVDWWLDGLGFKCFDSEQTYKKVILQPAEDIFGRYAYAILLGAMKKRYSIMDDIEQKRKEVSGEEIF